jgi:hypothetical protein
MPLTDLDLPVLIPSKGEDLPRTSDNNMFKFTPFVAPTPEEQSEIEKALILS